MKVAALFAMIAALAILAGAYATARHQAERDIWARVSERLSTKIADLESRIDKPRSQGESKQQPEASVSQELNEAATRLSAIEVEILEKRAELVQLKSDRLVADEYAKSSLDTLRQQVRKTTEIEQGLGALQSRRLQLRRHVADAEEKIDVLTETISARQDYADALERTIAELAIRQETARSRLALAEQTENAVTASLDELKDLPAKAEPSAETIKAEAVPAKAVPAVAMITPMAETSVTRTASPDQDRSKGLYRFKNLAVDQGTGGPVAAPDDETILAARPDEAADERMASDAWAVKQYELGRVLVTRGERNSGTRELNEAVLAFRAILGEWSRDRDPLRWAATQNDLGYALALLGQRRGDVGTLEKAATACRSALAEIGKEQTPLLWATAQYNLGLSLSGMASIKEEEFLWQNAIEALQKSVEAFEGGRAKAEEARAKNRLQDAYDQLAALRQQS